MKRTKMLRLGICLAMTTTSAAAFAGAQEATTSRDDQQVQSTKLTPNAEMQQTSHAADAGAAGGEPSLLDTRAREDARAKDAAAIQEYDHDVFLNQTWNSP